MPPPSPRCIILGFTIPTTPSDERLGYATCSWELKRYSWAEYRYSKALFKWFLDLSQYTYYLPIVLVAGRELRGANEWNINTN